MEEQSKSQRIRIIFTFATLLGAATGAPSLRDGEALSSRNIQANGPAHSKPQNVIENALPLDQTSQEIGTEDEQRRRTEFANQIIEWVVVFRRRIVPVIILGYVVVGLLFVLRMIVNQLSQL